MKLHNRVYDALKWITTIMLPAIGTLWVAIAEIWDYPHKAEVLGTLMAVITFLGVILGISSNSYNSAKVDDEVSELDAAPKRALD